MIDYYEVLEVSPNASEEVIKKAYQALVQKYHPNHFHSNYKQYATQRLKLVNESYSVLSNPEERRRYDAKLAEKTRISPPSQPKSISKTLLRIIGIALLVFFTFRIIVAALKTAFIPDILKLVLPFIVILILFWVFGRQNRSIKR